MISIIDLSMRFGAQILFKHVNLQFNLGCRYGLVGANGCGKSTFIKLLTGEIQPESGTFTIPGQYLLGTLNQDHYIYENEKIIDVVLRGREKLWQALEAKQTLLQDPNHFTDEACDQLIKLEKVIDEEKGYAASSEAAKLLEGLGIREEWHERPLNLLSGGYKLRVLLAKVFFSKPDILVLDEPTNHLDLYSIKWLENYLRHFEGILVVSSHDRDFLNAVCTHTVDVDYGTLKIYKGSYDQFLEQKAEERELKEALLEKYDKRRSDLQGFIDRFGAKATKARQAQSKAKLVDKLEDEMEAIDLSPSSRLYPNIQFNPLRPSGVTVLKVHQLSKAYGEKKVLADVSFEVERGDRLAIIGPNGIGKSTLLEILNEQCQADQGDFQWGFAARVAYFPQDHGREVFGDESLLEWLGHVDRSFSQEQLRDMLGKVLFSGDKVQQSIKTLSGGETARLILAKMMLQKPNILIFDEPTNHLDMEAIDELTKALQNFDGTLIFVSHNRYFVSNLANRILEITHKGMQTFKCTYSEYIEKQQVDHLSTQVSLKQRYAQDPSIESKNKTAASYEEQKKLRNSKMQLKKKITQIELECDRLEAEIKKLELLFASENFYEKASLEEQLQLLKQKSECEQQLGTAMEEWEATSLELQESENKGSSC